MERCGILASNFTKDELFPWYFSGTFTRQLNFQSTISVNFTAENKNVTFITLKHAEIIV